MLEIVTTKDGVELAGAVVNLAAVGAANATAIWSLSAGAQQVGTKSVKLKKISVRSNGVGAAEWLQIGTGVGAGYADLVPPIRTVDNMTIEEDLGGVESFATVTAFPVALAAGSLDVQIFVEERG